MKIHREGYVIILIAFLLLLLFEGGNYILYLYTGWLWLFGLLSLGTIVMFFLVVQFFRIPRREFSHIDNTIVCPADGKVVVIEEVEESEYFHDRRIQISIFMSPLNVHANYHPISGTVQYVKYHPGLFLVAWHPKSSTDNERTTIVTEHENGKKVLFRQVAGAVARRICYYVKEGQSVNAAEEFGFIKFGSRIDVFLPLDAKVKVKIGDKVKGRVTQLGEF